MLSQVTIKNFQSLHDVSLELRPFTVVVGPSSSGKSAFTRALKILTSNARGDSFITHGEQQCIITAKTDRGTVALLRGKKNEYTLIPEDSSEQQKSYTKLNGSVPEEVTEFIGIPAKDPLNYSSQFDMPYLLTATAPEVARTLGELTNVSIIFEAAREANKRRLAASGTLKTRAADYADLTVNLDRFRTLKDDLAKLEAAEQKHETLTRLQTRILRLASLLSDIRDAPPAVERRVFPDTEEVAKKLERIKTLAALITSIEAAATKAETQQARFAKARTAIRAAEEKYVEALQAMGACPTCGQSTKHLAHDEAATHALAR